MKKISIILLVIFYRIFSFGQQDLPVDVIQVVKDFDARLIEAEKIKVNPEVTPTDASPIKYQYQVNPGVQALNYRG